jgi:hypothetical protein
MKMTQKRLEVINLIKNMDEENFSEIRKIYSLTSKQFKNIKAFGICERQAWDIALAGGSIITLAIYLKQFVQSI